MQGEDPVVDPAVGVAALALIPVGEVDKEEEGTASNDDVPIMQTRLVTSKARKKQTGAGAARLATREPVSTGCESAAEQVARQAECVLQRHSRTRVKIIGPEQVTWEELTKKVWSAERELHAYVKLGRVACKSQGMSMSTTSDRWSEIDQQTADFVTRVSGELEWNFPVGLHSMY